MATIGPIAGTASIKVDGVQYQLRGSMTVDGMSTEKTGIAGQDQVHGFKVMPRLPKISGDFTPGDITFEQLEALRDAVVTADLRNGRSYVLTGAFVEGTVELNSEEGMWSITFAGARVTAL